MSSFADRFGELTVKQVRELNASSKEFKKEAEKHISALNILACAYDQEHYEKIADELLKLYELFGFEIQPSVIRRSRDLAESDEE